MRNSSVSSVLVVPLVFLFLTACTHEGSGQGTLVAPSTPTTGGEAKGPVLFSWQSKTNASDGSIQAKMPDGTDFKGTYLQITSQASPGDYGAYYSTWVDPMWGAPWYAGPEDAFVTRYSGRVVAHLQSDQGKRMRCTFALREPVSGLTGGAQGDCQLSDKDTVFGAQLPPSR